MVRFSEELLRSGRTPALVGVITRTKDWAILTTQHWYRIPVKNAPENLELARYLAFYQTRVFGAEKWAVNYYARVKAITVTRRIELLPNEPDHPRANEDYYRLEIEELKKLPNPILSQRRRRIVFIPTTLERLLTAKEINELYYTSPIEARLYRYLRTAELQPERQFFVRDRGRGYFLDLAVFCEKGKIDVECDGETYHSGRERAQADRQRDNRLTARGWRILRFSGSEINSDLSGCVAMVQRVVKRLGGIKTGKPQHKTQNPTGYHQFRQLQNSNGLPAGKYPTNRIKRDR